MTSRRGAQEELSVLQSNLAGHVSGHPLKVLPCVDPPPSGSSTVQHHVLSVGLSKVPLSWSKTQSWLQHTGFSHVELPMTVCGVIHIQVTIFWPG